MASTDLQREVFATVASRKRWSLVVSVWAFGVTTVAFATLFVVVPLSI